MVRIGDADYPTRSSHIQGTKTDFRVHFFSRSQRPLHYRRVNASLCRIFKSISSHAILYRSVARAIAASTRKSTPNENPNDFDLKVALGTRALGRFVSRTDDRDTQVASAPNMFGQVRAADRDRQTFRGIDFDTQPRATVGFRFRRVWSASKNKI
jgi:hypothetical protein